MRLHQSAARHAHLDLEREQLVDRRELRMRQRVLDHERRNRIALRHRAGPLRRGGHSGERKDGEQ